MSVALVYLLHKILYNSVIKTVPMAVAMAMAEASQTGCEKLQVMKIKYFVKESSRMKLMK
eukprot:6015982-Karenia_brevis.AAC.1